MGEFRGFGPKALAFFEALKFHQSKEWFDENRGLYEADVVAPMVALLGDLSATFAKEGPPLRADGKRSMFRIYRDVRFAKDKTPYKTHAGAVMTRSGAKNDNGLLYVHISPEGCFTAAGFYQPESADLARLRKAIVADGGKRYAAMLAALKKGKLALNDEPDLTRVPRGFESHKGGPLEGALRLKSFIVEAPLSDALILTPKLATSLASFARRARPLLDFGWQTLG